MLNLDTHVLIYLLQGALDPRESAFISQEELAISDIVLWEIAKLRQLGRLDIELEGREFRRALASLTVIPIRYEIAVQSTRLDFHSDPADELIAATSVVENIPLLTRDARILQSRMVPFPGEIA